METPKQVQGLTLRNEEFSETQEDLARLGILTTENRKEAEWNGTRRKFHMHVLSNQLDAYVIFAYLRSVLHGKSSKEHRKKKKKNTKRACI